MDIKIYFDGGSVGNRVCWYDNVAKKYYVKNLIKKCTNNELEYWALILAIKYYKKVYGFGDEFNPIFIGDSQLVVGQVAKGFKCNFNHLKDLQTKVFQELTPLHMNTDTYEQHIMWIGRDSNYAGMHLEKLINRERSNRI